MLLLAGVVVAVCTLDGQVVETGGSPLGGVAVVDAVRDTVLATTTGDGRFKVTVGAGDPVLEFRSPDHAPFVQATRCGTTLKVSLMPRVFRMARVSVQADRLRRTGEVTMSRVDRPGPGFVREASAGSPSLTQAVAQLPGVGAVGRDGFTAAPTIRGMGRGRSVVLLEGMRQSSDRGVGPSASFLDPTLVGSVAVVRGAAGVAWGSGAMGGVVRAGLPDPPDAWSAEARAALTTSLAGRLATARIGGPITPGWAATCALFRRTALDYRFPSGSGDPAGRATNSGLESTGGAGIVSGSVAGGTLRIAGICTNADEVGRSTTKPNRLDTIEEEGHRQISGRFAREENDSRTEIAGGVHRSWTTNRGERFDDEGTRTQTGHLRNESWDGSASVLVERWEGRGAWLGGLDAFFRRDVDAAETVVPFAGGVPGGATTRDLVRDGSRTDMGVFAARKWNPHPATEVLLAARADLAKRAARDRDDATWLAPSLTASVVWPLAPAWTGTAGLSRSFRAPRLSEMVFEGDRPGGYRLANPDLEPETAWSAETGFRWESGAWSAEGAVWGMLAHDLIVQLPVDVAGDTLRHENRTQGRLAGVEAAWSWTPDGGAGRVLAGYAFVYGADGQGNPLPDIPSGEFRLGGEWRLRKSMTARASVRAGSAKTPPSGGVDERWYSTLLGETGVGGDEAGHPGYARWDIGLRTDMGRPLAGARWTMDVTVSNVLDSRYADRPEANAYPQPGRTLTLELSARR
ncbi:MAG: TonB-dependent receptor [Gemmatimonadota bacterium]|nr:TonB-dependent receptor [Gemmatimonadota bacterium]